MRTQPTPREHTPPLSLDDLRRRAWITIDEAASFFGVSPRTARRWAADYIESNGSRGIPAVQLTARRRLCPAPKILEQLGLEGPSSASTTSPPTTEQPTVSPNGEPDANREGR